MSVEALIEAAVMLYTLVKPNQEVSMITMLMTSILMAIPSQAGESVGERPYEMVWANRNEDDHPPLIDFEDLTGWHLALKNWSLGQMRSEAVASRMASNRDFSPARYRVRLSR